MIEKLKIKLPRVKAVFNRINCGGCGFFAAILYSELKKLGLNPKIILIANSSDIEDYMDNGQLTESLAALNMNQIYLIHVMIKVGDYYLDAEGVHKSAWNGHEINITHASLKESLRKGQRHCWNRLFDWEQTKPITKTLKEIIKESLN